MTNTDTNLTDKTQKPMVVQSQKPKSNMLTIRLQKTQVMITKLALIDDLNALVQTLVEDVHTLTGYGDVLLLLMNEETTELSFSAITQNTSSEPETTTDEPLNPQQERLKNVYINTFNTDDAMLEKVLDNKAVLIEPSKIPSETKSPLGELAKVANFSKMCVQPLQVNDAVIGVLIIELSSKDTLSVEDHTLMQLLSANLAVIIHNRRKHAQTVEQLADKMREMSILQQIDQELNDTIELNTVFNMTCDWALRFTNADSASISLYYELTDTLETMFNYGYSITDEEIEALRGNSKSSIAYRVARTGRAEVVPDVSIDMDYQQVEQNIVAQMSVPVLREERVIAVLTLESKKLNAFTDAHLNFVKNLTNRAAVAIDNARLYNESEHERDKLSHILRNIVDMVIVINPEGKILLMNQSAMSALRLYSASEHLGQVFDEVIQFRPLVDLYKRARDSQESMTEEITLPNNRVYYTKAEHHEGIGWILVMQDVTPYKEMDKLKGELIATVSHDLKQPLSVMRGYLDLLQMKNQFDTSSENFINMIDRSILNMRQLIDDLLDLAKIESGIDLNLSPVSLKKLIREVVEINSSRATLKKMAVNVDMPADLLTVEGEENRLHQIFNNLVGNAIKYTPPEGKIDVIAERRGSVIRIEVKDNGLGISPEDQAHIFERFYRVRRPETESIDGTGLGLAIVKSLVEAHHGTIRLESSLGEGTNFIVTLPLADELSIHSQS